MNKKYRNPVTEGKIGKEMLFFFFPILFGYLFQQIYNIADALIVGRTLGKVALSAVGGSSGMIVMLIVGFFVGLTSGAAVLVSQYFGSGQEDKVSCSVHTVLLFSVACGAVITLVGILLTPTMLRWMQTPEETMEWSVIYLKVYFAGMIGNLIYNAGAGILRAVGDSRSPFLFLVVSCVLNVVLDLVFIIVIPMGVFGAALATILSQAVSAGMVLWTMGRRRDACHLSFRHMKLDGRILRKMIHVGLPAGLQSVMYGLSNSIIQVGVNGLGTDYVAAWATYYKIDGLFWATIAAFGIAGATFVGQNIGAGKKARVTDSIRVCILQAAIAAVLISIGIYLISHWIFPLFSADPGVNAIGVAMMRYLTRFYVLYVAIEILSGVLRGAGDTFVPMLLAVVGVCGIRSCWILFVLPKHPNMYTMMNSYPISWTITSIAFIIYLVKFSKLRPYLKREAKNQ
ncbi:MAG: MATE family efflux transporter [Lachnospiraceae bacterium]|nr:MATE family efflux transporter [Lachnospiraceae bacterium]